ncbi:MAG: RNA polymerase sigma-70 factor [Bacteroidales bacterium]|jgi:RNA polymerase sigma-70 factor (ECF subfamily)|nr:RNA polymerase sigma-70 factor [Bacteroidales bacterium]
MNIPDEKLLVKRLKEGNHSAFDQLFEIYHDRLFGFASSILKNRSDAEEIVEDVFIKVWEKKNDIKLYYSFKSFLFSITYNNVISFLRGKNRRDAVFTAMTGNTVEAGMEESAENYMIHKEKLREIEQAIEAMPYMRRKVFCMSRYEGKSYAEIALQLGISTNTVGNHISSALKFLRNKLGDKDLAILLASFIFFK